MKAIEEAGNVLRLRTQARPRSADDLRIEAEALRDVDAGRRTRNTNPKLVRWLERGLIESDCRIHNARGVDAINLQRCVMCRDYGDAADAAEMVGNRNRRRG